MIDTTALKNSILDLAFHGKLTSQNVTDGSAEELYNQICDEKRELIKSGKIKKNKIVPIKEEDIPFEIPNNWKWIRWGDLSEKIQYGYNASAKSEGRIKMVRISDIQDNKVLWDTVPYCEIDEEQIPEYLLKENDILFARTGGTVGKSYIVSDVSEDAVFAGYLIRTSYSNKLSSQYMKYFMESKLYWKQLRNGTIATAQPNCNGQTLSKMMVPLPPYAEQVRINETIEKAFAQIDVIDSLQQQYSSDLEVLKSKIIDAGIQGKLTEQLPGDGTADELLKQIDKEKKALKDAGIYKNKKKITIKKSISKDEIFEIPKSWKWVRLGQLADVYGRIGFRGYTKADLVDAGQGAISMSPSNITFSGNIIFENNTYITWEKYDESPEIKVREGDVLIVKTGSSYGKTGIIEEMPEKCTINPQLAILKNILCDRYYLNLYMKSSHAWNQYNSFVVGAATPTFSQEKLANMLIPLPPLNEQKRIVDRVKRIFDVV